MSATSPTSPLAKTMLNDAQRLNRAAAGLPVPPSSFPGPEEIDEVVKTFTSPNRLDLEPWEECANAYPLTGAGEVALRLLCTHKSHEDLQRLLVELDEVCRRKYRRRLLPAGFSALANPTPTASPNA